MDGHLVDTHLPQGALHLGALGPELGKGVFGPAVERALAREGHVVAMVGVDQRRIVEHLGALPDRQHGRQVVAGILAEADDGALGQMQIDVAFEDDRTVDPVLAGRDDHTAAALVAAAGDGVVDGLARIDRGVRRGSEIEDVVFGIAEFGGLDRFEDFPGPFGQSGTGCGAQGAASDGCDQYFLHRIRFCRVVYSSQSSVRNGRTGSCRMLCRLAIEKFRCR